MSETTSLVSVENTTSLACVENSTIPETVPATAATHHANLPGNLGVLASLTAASSYRYSLQGIHLKIDGETYRAEATDGRVLGVITGPCDDAKDYPHVGALASAPNGECEAMIPGSDWKSAFKGLPKGRLVRNKPILGTLGVVIGKEVTTLVSTDLERVNIAQPRQMEGRFPNIDAVLPKDAPLATLCINPHLLIDLLKVAAEVCDENNPRVMIELRGKNTPLIVRSEKGEQKLTGLVMPVA